MYVVRFGSIRSRDPSPSCALPSSFSIFWIFFFFLSLSLSILIKVMHRQIRRLISNHWTHDFLVTFFFKIESWKVRLNMIVEWFFSQWWSILERIDIEFRYREELKVKLCEFVYAPCEDNVQTIVVCGAHYSCFSILAICGNMPRKIFYIIFVLITGKQHRSTCYLFFLRNRKNAVYVAWNEKQAIKKKERKKGTTTRHYSADQSFINTY